MGTSDLTKFPGGTQDKGVNVFEPDIGADITWDEETNNVSSGIERGVSPRYGVAPLAGHSNTETPTNCNGLMRSETTSGTNGLTHRDIIFGIVPITMTDLNSSYPKPNKQYYAYIVGLSGDSPVPYCLDVCLGATDVGAGVYGQAPDLTEGLAASSYRQESPLVRRHKTELLNLPQATTPTAADMQALMSSRSGLFHIPYAHISVSGKRVPYQWMLGKSTNDPDLTHSPAVCLWTTNTTSGLSPTIYCGAPSEIITREFVPNTTRKASFYCLTTAGATIDMYYTGDVANSDTTAVTKYGTSAMYARVTATKTGASTAYNTVSNVLIYDPGSYTNTRHDAILMAGEAPYAVVYQDWLQAAKGMMPRWVDLTNPTCNPRILGNTLIGGSTFQGQGSSMPTAVPSEEGANTGILRANTTYQFGFSMYNKLLDYETNVVLGADHTTSATDFQAISFDQLGAAENVWTNFNGGSLFAAFPWDFSPSQAITGSIYPRGLSLNDYEYRLYYREAGTSEWLPGGNYDAAQYWFYTAWSPANPRFCTGPVAGLPGGQPNGFVDYSPLPKQRYICTVVFQQRAFWWSEKSMHFSYANNIYAYPTRNIVACPTGKWRGGIVHSQKDLSQQLSRLVVFGDQSYSCRFTGERTLQSVRISADTVGQFDIDGSDFRMEYLCDATAFSYRSACIAEGVLYWWGPQGVYRDDGVTSSKKISEILEPDIWAYVDMARDKEVHCVYNKRTMEVIWFYPPKVADASFPTYLLIYNVENGNFYPGKMRCQVDASQNIKIENDETPDDVDGERILIHCRETTAATTDSRTFYFDDLVEAGEQGPGRELTVVSVSTPVAGTRRFTLASGSIGITAGSIVVGDYICVNNAKGYAPGLTDADDMIAKITAVSNGSSYLEVTLPDGASFDSSATLAAQTCFPIYHKKAATAGLHGITYKMQTNYWLPAGVSESWNWLYLYLLFKYSGIPTPTDAFTNLPIGAQIDLAYRTLRCSGFITDTLKLTDNSDGNCQIHHPLRNQGRAANGQALKYKLSGIHIGNPWTLQYLEAHCKKDSGFTLKEFEG